VKRRRRTAVQRWVQCISLKTRPHQHAGPGWKRYEEIAFVGGWFGPHPTCPLETTAHQRGAQANARCTLPQSLTTSSLVDFLWILLESRFTRWPSVSRPGSRSPHACRSCSCGGSPRLLLTKHVCANPVSPPASTCALRTQGAASTTALPTFLSERPERAGERNSCRSVTRRVSLEEGKRAHLGPLPAWLRATAAQFLSLG